MSGCTLPGMITNSVTITSSIIDLRRQAHFWRAQHSRAVQREAAWKENAQQLDSQVKQLAATVADQHALIEALKAKVALLQQQAFGQKSEQTPLAEAKVPPESPPLDESPAPTNSTKRKRGKQPGTKGHGRRRRLELPAEPIVVELPEDKTRCPDCGEPFQPFPGTEDGEEIHWEVRLVRRVY